ncbi:hypothetical protein F5Y00DRAFT_267787 [Daldinia vernicosa]|uniref:uncharacterized protein n=1 Tax=Daldinia vernicosa TaxID=114800 RepID=UPI002007FD70|nr:uncharacterized protein F5Y00DRAFT_267787 [Daldinia vernicosa]KAI0843813.1 hypothetical protein F5Y00DRAFT_267787 [Daldinia vernicosa]
MPKNRESRKTNQASKFSHLLHFIQGGDDDGENHHWSTKQKEEAFANTPIFTTAVEKFVHSTFQVSSSYLTTSTSTDTSSASVYTAFSTLSNNPASELVPQYGLIGIRQDSADANVSAEDRLVLANMNVPWSAFICGSQGAGKSHTLSCLLENALISNNAAGRLPYPLAGMVMHYDKYTSYSSTQVCEAAYLGSSGIPVTILVSPSNLWAMRNLYGNLPGVNVKVLPLYLNEDQLDISRMLKLMAIDPAAKDTPLYMEVVMNIAREMAMEGPGVFTYSRFCERLSKIKWVKGQEAALKLRLQLLDAFISPSSTTTAKRPARAQEDIWAFEPGSLTIVDLSDPFLSSDDACSLFSICLSIFLEERNKCGRIVALDEAHKFLTQAGEAKILTGDLLSIIRQQRHTGTRVLIATQEPTLSPELIDLSNVTFVHRFLSPSWYETLKKHLAGAKEQNSGDASVLFDTIIALQTGEALLFCPTAQVDVAKSTNGLKQVKPLGNGHVKIKMRKRLTVDGGRSIMATDALVEALERSKIDNVLTGDAIPKLQNDKNGPAKVVGTLGSSAKPNDPNKSVPNDTFKTPSTTAGAASNTNTPTAKAPSGGQMKKELKRQVQEMFKDGSWTSFKDLTKSQKAQLFSGVDTRFQLPPGTAAKNKMLNSFFYIALDKVMDKLKESKDKD